MRRFREIMDQSENSSDTDTIKVTAKMDHLERMLFQEGRRTKRGMRDWLERRTGVIAASSMVARHRKRKANFDCGGDQH